MGQLTGRKRRRAVGAKSQVRRPGATLQRLSSSASLQFAPSGSIGRADRTFDHVESRPAAADAAAAAAAAAALGRDGGRGRVTVGGVRAWSAPQRSLSDISEISERS